MRLRTPLFIMTLVGIAVLSLAGWFLADIDTDVTRFLPRHDPVIADAGVILKHHPLQGRIAIDLAVQTPDPDRLLRGAQLVENRLQASGLFREVGMTSLQADMPSLLRHIVTHLPVLFSAEELHASVLPMLSPERIQERLALLQSSLLGLDAIGQAEFIAADPLGLRDIVLARMARMAPDRPIDLYQGRLLSTDHRHLLIVATPASPGTDTAFAAHLESLLGEVADALRMPDNDVNPVVMTPMGAYRAALDNERIARRDVQKALLLATLGIAMLLLLAFPRPVLGLFAFLPAAAGTAGAFFILALLHQRISIMALGFGAAVISITVDHGIAYLLFLDQTRTTYGKNASREIWAIGLVAALTTIGAFSALHLTGFPILAQLGQFAALGIALAFVFVHWVFPKIFPEMPPAKVRDMPFRRLVARLPLSGKTPALAALAIAGVLLFFAKPTVDPSLSRMNTVSKATQAAETLMEQVWGGAVFDQLFLMTTAGEIGELQDKADRLLALAEADMRAGHLAQSFLPAMLFPGETRRRIHFNHWRGFWSADRIEQIRHALAAGHTLGFTETAFEPFLQRLAATAPPADDGIPETFRPLMGIATADDGTWMQFTTLSPGPAHDPGRFQDRYGAVAKIFDPGYFSNNLGKLLFDTFLKMVAVIGAAVTVLILFFFLDPKLTAIALSPLIFALICTMGTLNLIGHPLDIPGLMLAIVVLGMGTDYTLLLVRARQRYGDAADPGFERIRMAVVMAAFSTLVGFGVLCLADHALLYSAGITSLLGIAYALVGSFVLLPPLLAWHFDKARVAHHHASYGDINRRILQRYSAMEAYPRMFSRGKLKMDVLFKELPDCFPNSAQPRIVLDIGCGYGVPGCWVLERFPSARVWAIDPDVERTRVAGRAFGHRGSARHAAAPDLPVAPAPADAALLLDILHYIDDDDLSQTFQRLYAAMAPGSRLIIRALVPPPGRKRSWRWRLEEARIKQMGIRPHYRPPTVICKMVAAAGFAVVNSALSGANPELAWVLANRSPDHEVLPPGRNP